MKTFSLVIAIIGMLTLGAESITNFENTKIAYASFNFDKYFYKDYFHVPDDQWSMSKNYTRLYAYGKFCSDSTKTYCSVNASGELTSNNKGEYPVWRCKLTSRSAFYIGYGRLDNLFTYNMRSYFFTLVFLFLLFPSITCYIFLKIRQNKNIKSQNISK